MQYLVNKTKGVVSSFLSPKIGTVSLMPYEAIPVDVEHWDAQAFNSVRNNPTIMGIFDRVPKEYAEKRKAFLAVEGVEIDSAKQREIEEAEKTLANLEAIVSTQKEELEETYKALNEVELGILEAKNNLPTDEKALKKALKVLDKQEQEFVKARDSYNTKKEEFASLLDELETAKSNVEALKEK